MNISQDELFNAIISHQSYLYRLSGSEVAELSTQFNQISNKALSNLRDLLDDLTDAELQALMAGLYTTANLKAVRAAVQTWQSSLVTTLNSSFQQSAIALAMYETTFQAKLFGEKFNSNEKTLYSAIKKKPLSGGLLLDYLFEDIADSLKTRVESTLRDGIYQGQTNQQIIQRLKGTKTLNYQDGILNQSRNDIERLARTARSHVTNQAAETVYKSIGVSWLKVVATLDSRTCKYCASVDGNVYSITDENRPHFPVHPRNRTIYAPVTSESGETIGSRPSNARISKKDTKGEITTVDSNTSYKAWFDKQSEAFQKQWLGSKRYDLYKKGDYSLDKFVDPLSGQSFTLEELKRKDAKTFREVGI